MYLWLCVGSCNMECLEFFAAVFDEDLGVWSCVNWYCSWRRIGGACRPHASGSLRSIFSIVRTRHRFPEVFNIQLCNSEFVYTAMTSDVINAAARGTSKCPSGITYICCWNPKNSHRTCLGFWISHLQADGDAFDGRVLVLCILCVAKWRGESK